MRIDPNTRTPAAEESGQTAASSARTTAASDGEARAGDSAQLSLDQVRVQALAVQVNALPEIRQEKVAALGRAVRDGSYQVSPEQTADSLISEMLAGSAAA